MATKIRKNQIKTEEFIIPEAANPLWTSETETASQLAIANKISSLIAGVTGAMVYKGAWSSVPANGVGVKRGWLYVYDGTGTAPSGVTLEAGDTLIANIDTANPTTAADWTVVQTNIDDTYLWEKVKSFIVAGSNITVDKNDSNKRITISGKGYPTISSGAQVAGSYVSGLSISNSGVITVSRTVLPDSNIGTFTREELTGANGGTSIFNLVNTPTFIFGIYINGVQVATSDYTVNSRAIQLTGGYIPDATDDFWCVYLHE